MADFDFKLDKTALDALVGKEVERRAIKVESAAKRFAPVDFGRLQSSITHQMGKDGRGAYADIGTDVEYAIHQEFGTRYMSAQPFLRPGLDEGTR